MARRITISTFSSVAGPCAAGKDLGDHVIGFWRSQIERVLPDRPDLIVLPELCDQCDVSRAFEAYIDDCRQGGGRFREALGQIAKRNRLFITCPTLRRAADGTLRNSVELLDRDGGTAGIYDKNYPTIEEMELGIGPGDSATVFETELGRIACVICFDLNFEELRRRYAEQRPELILFCSMYHGGLMQTHWAYSCRAHFVGAVCRLPSEILSPVGHRIAASTNYFPLVTAQVNLDCAMVHLDAHWKKLDDIKAKYGREVSIFDPGLLAPVLVASQSEDRSIKDIFREFEMELVDDYFERARKARNQALKA